MSCCPICLCSLQRRRFAVASKRLWDRPVQVKQVAESDHERFVQLNQVFSIEEGQVNEYRHFRRHNVSMSLSAFYD